MKSPLSKLNKSANTVQISTLLALLLVASPVLASDLAPGEYLNSSSNQIQGQNQTQPGVNYQGYAQAQQEADPYAASNFPNAQSNYQYSQTQQQQYSQPTQAPQQAQQQWQPLPAQPSQSSQPYYGQAQQSYNQSYQQPTTSVNMSGNAQAWQGAQPLASETSTQNTAANSQNQNSGATGRALTKAATSVLPAAASLVGMGLVNKMRTGSFMGYGMGGYGMGGMGMGGYGGYGNGYGGYGNGYGGYGNGYGGGYGGYGNGYGGYGMNPMSSMGMNNSMLNMIHF